MFAFLVACVWGITLKYTKDENGQGFYVWWFLVAILFCLLQDLKDLMR